MRGADRASDHQLVRIKIKMKLKRKQQTKANRRKFDTIKLQQPSIRLQFSIKLKNRFDVLQGYEELEDNAEKKWQEFENAYKETAKETLGYKQKGQKPWISKKSWELVEERRKQKNAVEQTKSDRIKQNLKDDYKRMDKEVKKSMRRDKRRWAENLATEAEEAAGNGRMKKLYEITKTLSNDKRKAINTVKDKHGNLLTEDSARKNRWREHFEEILNRPVPDDPIIEEVDDTVIEDISIDFISKDEIRTAFKRMKNGRFGGKDEITAELLKADINTAVDWLHNIFKTIWDKEVPKTWKQGLIVKIPKKGDLTECGNGRVLRTRRN